MVWVEFHQAPVISLFQTSVFQKCDIGSFSLSTMILVFVISSQSMPKVVVPPWQSGAGCVWMPARVPWSEWPTCLLTQHAVQQLPAITVTSHGTASAESELPLASYPVSPQERWPRLSIPNWPCDIWNARHSFSIDNKRFYIWQPYGERSYIVYVTYESFSCKEQRI